MTPAIRIERIGPLATLQDSGRPGMLAHGVTASGPMDRGGFERAAARLAAAGTTGIEFTQTGIAFSVEQGPLAIGCAGGGFALTINGTAKPWPHRASLRKGDRVEITPGLWGNYGYVRFDGEVEVPLVMGSRATNSIAGLGGFEGRALAVGDQLLFAAPRPGAAALHPRPEVAREPTEGNVLRVIWGLHAEHFAPATREGFVNAAFRVSPQLDRMGIRLADPSGVFARTRALSLVSDAIVPGDIQILGDGTPIILMRDHQPTGGYPRIATVISADLDRLAQIRPGAEVCFVPVTIANAHRALGARP